MAKIFNHYMKTILAAFAAAIFLSTAAAQQDGGGAEAPRNEETAAGPENTAISPEPPKAGISPAAQTAPARKIRKIRRKTTAGKPAPVDPKKVNILLYGTMERLDILSSLYENLGLRLSTDTLRKAYEFDKAVNRAAAPYFKVQEPSPGREAIRNYRGLLESVLRSVKILKEIKNRLRPAETESAVLAARDLYLAMDDELSSPKLIPVAIEPKTRPQSPRPQAAGAGGEHLANETETLFAISELTFALNAYKKEEESFPKRLKDLAPRYIPAIPYISIADHARTAEVVEIDSQAYDADYTKAFRDTGKWLYFSGKKSAYYGRIFVDCTHKNAQGVEFYKIGERK
ncbi:MAG: hypothetical protein WCW52_04620 [Elusimicrobiales bacterium]|jgi:hypothetical protein